MNIKDVTTTSFGLIVAYLLPGLVGLYTISLYAKGVRALFAHPNEAVGFLLLLLFALLVGVLVNGVRALIHDALIHYKVGKPFGAAYFNKIDNSDKLACFMAVLDEYFRVFQFFGSLAVISPPLYIGWALCGVLSIPAAVVLGLLTTAVTISASSVTWSHYVDIGHRILEGEFSESVFAELRLVVRGQSWKEAEKTPLLTTIDTLQDKKGTSDFVKAYKDFVTLAADRNVLFPLFPALTKWIKL